jgi:hypothetical protein
MNRKLAIYICCVALLQSILYVLAFVDREAGWLFYFDPRIGLSAIESALRRADAFPGIGSSVSAVILGGVGIGLLFDVVTVNVYLVTEAVLATPTLVFFVWVAIVNLSPSHSFSPSELSIPIIVFAVASGIPFWMGIQARRVSRAKSKRRRDY